MNFTNCNGVETSIVPSPHELANTDLVEEYQKLSTCYINQKEFIDQCRQQIYTLTQEKARTDNIMKDELQSVSESYDLELENVRKKCMADNKDLQNRLTTINVTNEKLESENERLKNELNEANNPLKFPVPVESKICDQDETVVSNKRIEYLERIETEYLTLIDDVSKLNSEKSELVSQLIQTENMLREAQECYECSRENLKYKTSELDDAQNIIDSLQEKLANTANELASYKNGNIDHNTKGNSLFAEVDDQRQQMRSILHSHKQQYQMMKQKYSESNDEICRLKRENVEIYNEMKECVNMFKNADKFCRSKLNEHIGFLKMENNRLAEKLQKIQSEMDSLAKTHGVDWLSSMLEYCEKDTKDLNLKLMSYGMKKCEAEGLYAQAQETAAKWRFEALKSRCIIMNREMLLESNHIKFEPKLLNIRQMIEKIFDANEEPIIDDNLCSPASIKSDSVKNVETSEKIASVEIDRSWSDVKEIFATLNKQAATSKNTYCNKLVKAEGQNVVKSNSKSEGECLKIQKFIQNKENTFDRMDQNTPKIMSTTNSLVHSINNVSVREFNSNVTKVELATEKSNILSPIINSAELKTVGDPSSHVRQLNVEMFTITLKRRDSPKSNTE